MRNKIDFNQPPETLFLNPGQSEAIRLVKEPRFFWRAVEPAIIRGFAASAHSRMNARITGFVDQARKKNQFSKAVEFDTVPVVLQNAEYRKSFVLADGKLVLNGASGTRALNQYRWENNGSDADPEQQLNGFFEDCRQKNAQTAFAFADPEETRGLDFAVECRNTFNYFHFITESLCQLCVLDEIAFDGTVYFHFPNDAEKQREFAKGFVDALFPELAGRVVFSRSPAEYDNVLTAYDLIGCHFQFPQPGGDGISQYAPGTANWQDDDASAPARTTLGMNSFRSALAKLRQRALRAVDGMDVSHLPRRFFVGRDDRQSRDRILEGMEDLFDHLQLFGFEYVVFENLSPLEQIALMVNAEMMVSSHGAGFTNMLFANHDSWIVELGTHQTATTRWADFWPLAHVSGCRYISFFADHKQDDPLLDPDFAKDGIVPVSLSPQGLARVMAFIVTVLGHVPSLKKVDDLTHLVQALLQSQEPEQALAVLDAHDDVVKGDPGLCLSLADCHKALDTPKSELVALDLAFRANPQRWQTLVRIIWCANRVDKPEVIRWALDRLSADFPERHDAFTSNHQWVRYVA